MCWAYFKEVPVRPDRWIGDSPYLGPRHVLLVNGEVVTVNLNLESLLGDSLALRGFLVGHWCLLVVFWLRASMVSHDLGPLGIMAL